MSERSDIPVSTLSKVEHDRLTLTYDKLVQLSQRLDIRMSDLFAEAAPAADSAVTGRRSIGRMADAVRVETPNYDYYYLCTELRQKRMIPILTRIRAKSLEEFGDLVSHSGEEYIHVLEGDDRRPHRILRPGHAGDRRGDLHRFEHGPRLCRGRGLRRGAGARRLREQRRGVGQLADADARAGGHQAKAGGRRIRPPGPLAAPPRGLGTRPLNRPAGLDTVGEGGEALDAYPVTDQRRRAGGPSM